MNKWRLLIYVCAAVGLLVLGFVMATMGMWACDPAALPGDGFWTWRRRLVEAFFLAVFGGSRACFAGGAGDTMVTIAGYTPIALGILAVAALIWETAGRRARLVWLARRGGHAVLAGNRSTIHALDRRERRQGSVLHIAIDPTSASQLARAHPFRELAIMSDRADAPRLVSRFAVRKARVLAAATDSDLSNLALCEAAIRSGSEAELLMRLEQPSVRALGSLALRRLAREAKAELTVVSLDQLQVRRGVALAMPGRYVVEGAERHHLVVCGSGPAMQEVAFQLSRQGFGLEISPPLLTILRTGQSDFAAGALDRLASCSAAVTLSISSVDATDPLAVERAMSAAALNPSALSSIHCIGQDPAEADQLARHWERVLLDFDLPVPPIVVYADGASIGETGMIRHAVAVDLADARDVARRMDARARTAHETYLEGERRARGAAFGSAAAEKDWAVLPDTFQDENRNAADHVEYKLALAGFAVRPVGGPAATLKSEDIEALAPIEHARWLASRTVAGYRWAAERDNDRLLHPDLIPYESLTEDGKRKDRDTVAALPALLALGGERTAREIVVGAVLGPDESVDAAHLISALFDWAGRHPERWPVVRMPLDGIGPVALAEALAGAGFATEFVQDRPFFATLPTRDRARLAERTASVLAQAWRIRTTRAHGQARAWIAAASPVVIGSNGEVHAETLP
ncbi:MAG: RyR domain-containing protein [Rhizobiaceae bacterium]